MTISVREGNPHKNEDQIVMQISAEGAEYIADIMASYQGHDAGGRQISETIYKELELIKTRDE